ADGPLFVIETMHVRLLVTATGLGDRVAATERFADVFAGVMICATLFEATESISPPATIAVFVTNPMLVGASTICAVPPAPFARFPKSHSTAEPVFVHAPPTAFAETKFTPLGSGLVNMTRVAPIGPWLVTVNE